MMLVGCAFENLLKGVYVRQLTRGQKGNRISMPELPVSENEMSRRPRRRFSAEEKARIVGLYEESGLTRVEFCRREGIGLFNLQRWLGKRKAVWKSAFCGSFKGSF